MGEVTARDAVMREMQWMEQMIRELSSELGTALAKQSEQHLARIDEHVARIVSKQLEVLRMVPLLTEQQKLHARIQALETYNQDLDDLVQVSALKVYEAESALMDELSVASLLAPAGEKGAAQDGDVDDVVEIDPDDLVNYAARVRGILGAPMNWDMSKPLPPGFFPPAPSEEMMRASKLGQLSAPETFKNVLLSQTLHVSKKRQREDSDSDENPLSANGSSSSDEFDDAPME